MANELIVYAGTYTNRHPFGRGVGRRLKNLLDPRGRSSGIHVLRLDSGTGRLAAAAEPVAAEHPSWVAVHPSGRFLYAVNEVEVGAVSAYAVGDDGTLHLVNRQLSGGDTPCHVAIEPRGRCLYVANYASGTVSTHEIAEDGAVGSSVDLVRHYGGSIDRVRQAGPHPHCIAIAPGGAHAFVPDLGMDRVMLYGIDPITGRLEANDPSFIPLTPGQGPRFLAFHPAACLAYLVNELGSTVVAFRYGPTGGAVERVQTASTLPAAWSGRSTASHVEVHPCGRFLYVSNRGHDSIAVFELTPDGDMGPIEVVRTGGRTPRAFTIDPAGAFLLAAHQTSDHVITFRIDPARGTLVEVARTKIPTCVCLAFRRSEGVE